jgi:hypothetical protein
MIKKPTAAQLAARKKFAERAKAGTLQKKSKTIVKKIVCKVSSSSKIAALLKKPKSKSKPVVKRQANPITVKARYRVMRMFMDDWEDFAYFIFEKDVRAYAKAYATANPKVAIRVWDSGT